MATGMAGMNELRLKSLCVMSNADVFPTQNELTNGWEMAGRPVYLLVGSLTSQQHASVSQGRICSDNFTCCYTEIKVADQTFYLIQSQYTDTAPTSPRTNPVTPGA